MKLRLAQIRLLPEKGKLEANFAALRAGLAALAPRRPDVVITPECFLDGYVATETHVTSETLLDYAIDPVSSSYAHEISAWAAAHSSWFIFGCTRRGPAGAHNTALIYDRSGRLAGMYDKVHCQHHDGKFVAGGTLPVWESDFGRFGVMICADRRWPETVRTLALRGARIIFNPTYGMCCDLNLAMMRTRSWESEVFIAFTHPRQSLLTDPRGQALRNERRGDRRFSITTVDLDEVDRQRAQGSPAHLRDRRSEVYRLGLVGPQSHSCAAVRPRGKG